MGITWSEEISPDGLVKVKMGGERPELPPKKDKHFLGLKLEVQDVDDFRYWNFSDSSLLIQFSCTQSKHKGAWRLVWKMTLEFVETGSFGADGGGPIEIVNTGTTEASLRRRVTRDLRRLRKQLDRMAL